MTQGGVLFLDLGLQTGWVYGLPGDPVPEWGFWELPEGTYAQRFNAFVNVLEDAIRLRKPKLIGIEEMIPQKHNKHHIARITGGLHALADLVCLWEDVPSKRIHELTLRSAVCGRSRLTTLEKTIRPKVTVKSEIVLPWIQSKGWEITNHNAADAAVGWAYLTGIRALKKGLTK